MGPKEAFLFPQKGEPLSFAEFDNLFHSKGYSTIAGVDEAGRGPLAGPVVAASVVFEQGVVVEEIDDSKKLSPSKREMLCEEILKKAKAVGIGIVGVSEIDRINILQASLKAMKVAVGDLSCRPDLVLIDGIFKISSSLPQHTVKKGDSLSHSIAAASIVAKVTRDRIMDEYHKQYPHYAFDRHKGYGTTHHKEALRKYGCSPIHRKRFRNVQEILKDKGGEFPLFRSG
jgi:ribonuclease HII